MSKLDVRDLRGDFDSAFARLAAGEVLTITEGDRPIGELRPPTGGRGWGSAGNLVASGFASWDGGKPELPSVPGVAPFSLSDLVLQEREEGVLRLLKGALAEPKAP